MTTLGFNQDNAITTLGTIKSRSILQNGHFVDILGIDVQQQVCIVTRMHHRTGLLHILNHTINHNQRLSIGCERIQTTNKHGCTNTRSTRTGNGTDIRTHEALNIGINGLRRGVRDTLRV